MTDEINLALNEHSDMNAEAMHIDPRETITVEQILDVVQRVRETVAQSPDKAKESVTETTAFALAEAASNTLDNTKKATALGVLQSTHPEGFTQDDFNRELMEVDIRMKDTYFIVEGALSFVSGESSSEHSRGQFLDFIAKEIEMLEEALNSPTEYDATQVTQALATLNSIRDYYNKRNDVRKPQEEPLGHVYRKATVKPKGDHKRSKKGHGTDGLVDFKELADEDAAFED